MLDRTNASQLGYRPTIHRRCIEWLKARFRWLRRRDFDEGHVGIRKDGTEYVVETRAHANKISEKEVPLPTELQAKRSPCGN